MSRAAVARSWLLFGLAGLYCVAGQATADELRFAWFPKTERSQAGEATPRLTLDYPEEPELQESPELRMFEEDQTDFWRPCANFMTGASLNGNNLGATNGDLTGGTVAGQLTFQYSDTQRLVPLVGGHYTGVSHGGNWSTTFGLLRPAGADRWLSDFDFGVAFDLVGADNLHGTSQQYQGSQISLAAGALLLPDTQLRLLYTHTLSGVDTGTQILDDQSPLGPMIFVPVTFQPRGIAQASLDYQLHADLIMTASLTHVTHPNQLFAGVAADWRYGPGRHIFADVQIGEGGDIFAFAGLGFTLGPCPFGASNGSLKPLFNPGQPVFTTPLAAVPGGVQCIPGSMLPCP